MKGGSKYQPLLDYLRAKDQREVTLSFAHLELIINDNLPGSARSSKAWWSNRKKGGLQASAWKEAGYEVAKVDFNEESVTFRKSSSKYEVEPVENTIEWNSETIKAMRLQIGLTQKELAQALGVRQQTVSDWENGVNPPTRSNANSLNRVAEKSGFKYGEGS